MPKRAHPTDAGLDLKSRGSREILPRGSAVFDTGVHVELPHGFYGKIESRSSLNLLGIVSCGGVIDEGYTGSIIVKLYNMTDSSYRVNDGEKIAQLVIQPYATPEMEIASELAQTERGDSGFGSTGK